MKSKKIRLLLILLLLIIIGLILVWLSGVYLRPQFEQELSYEGGMELPVLVTTKEKYGSTKCQVGVNEDIVKDDFDFPDEYVDLDGDRVRELIALPNSICGESVRGNTGNGPIFIFSHPDISELTLIGEMNGQSYEISENFTDGYRDIIISIRNGYATYSYEHWKWNARLQKYELSSSQ